VGGRRPKRASIAGVLVFLAGALVGLTAPGSAKAQTLDLGLCDARQHTFTTNTTNQFFPLP
jgi:hypothetical protein